MSKGKIYFKNLLALIVPCLNWFYLRKHLAKFQVLSRPPVPRVLVVIKWQCNFQRCSWKNVDLFVNCYDVNCGLIV